MDVLNSIRPFSDFEILENIGLSYRQNGTSEKSSEIVPEAIPAFLEALKASVTV